MEKCCHNGHRCMVVREFLPPSMLSRFIILGNSVSSENHRSEATWLGHPRNADEPTNKSPFDDAIPLEGATGKSDRRVPPSTDFLHAVNGQRRDAAND